MLCFLNYNVFNFTFVIWKYANIFYICSYAATLSFMLCIVSPNLAVVFQLNMLHRKNYLVDEFVMCFGITFVCYFHLMSALLQLNAQC